MKHETMPQAPGTETYNDYVNEYDIDSHQAEWNSPEKALKLVENYIHEGATVLDIGVGTGQSIEGYPEKGVNVVGIDNDKDMLDAAGEVTGGSGEMRQADINEHLPVEDLEGRVDVAQAIGVLEFAEDIDRVFDQVNSTLKVGGVFVFTVETRGQASSQLPEVEHYPGADVTVYRRTPEEIYDLLSEKELTLLYDESYEGYDRGDMDGAKVPYHIFLASK